LTFRERKEGDEEGVFPRSIIQGKRDSLEAARHEFRRGGVGLKRGEKGLFFTASTPTGEEKIGEEEKGAHPWRAEKKKGADRRIEAGGQKRIRVEGKEKRQLLSKGEKKKSEAETRGGKGIGQLRRNGKERGTKVRISWIIHRSRGGKKYADPRKKESAPSSVRWQRGLITENLLCRLTILQTRRKEGKGRRFLVARAKAAAWAAVSRGGGKRKVIPEKGDVTMCSGVKYGD